MKNMRYWQQYGVMQAPRRGRFQKNDGYPFKQVLCFRLKSCIIALPTT